MGDDGAEKMEEEGKEEGAKHDGEEDRREYKEPDPIIAESESGARSKRGDFVERVRNRLYRRLIISRQARDTSVSNGVVPAAADDGSGIKENVVETPNGAGASPATTSLDSKSTAESTPTTMTTTTTATTLNGPEAKSVSTVAAAGPSSVNPVTRHLTAGQSDDDSGCALEEYTWVPPGLKPEQVRCTIYVQIY